MWDLIDWEIFDALGGPINRYLLVTFDSALTFFVRSSVFARPAAITMLIFQLKLWAVPVMAANPFKIYNLIIII